MAYMTFSKSPDKPQSVDASLEIAGDWAAPGNKPIRCRLQPDLYDWKRTNYSTWQGLSWTIDLEDVAEGRRLRQGLTYFFEAFAGDAKRQKRLLAELKGWAKAEREEKEASA